MAKKRTRFSFTVSDDLYDKINTHQHQMRFGTQTKAVNDLLEKGIEKLYKQVQNPPLAKFDNYSAQEMEMLARYRSAHPAIKNIVDVALQVQIEDICPIQNKVMPVYVFPAAAGTPLYAEDDFEEIEFPEDQVPANADFGIRIRGDSMEPTIEDGAIVWVKRQQELQNGQIGVFMLHDEAVCKRFERIQNGIRLLSDNETYAPIEVTDYETFCIVGRVLEYR